MSRKFRFSLIVLLLLLLIGLVASEMMGWRYLRSPIATFASSALGREVQIDPPFRLHFRSTIQVSAGGVSIAAPDWAGEKPFLALKAFEIRAAWKSLFGGPVTLPLVSIDEGEVRLIRSSPDKASWQFTDNKSTEGEEALVLPVVERVELGPIKIVLGDNVNELRLNVVAQTSESSGGKVLSIAADGSFRNDPVTAEIEAPNILSTGADDSSKLFRVKSSLGETKLFFTGSVANLLAADGIKGQVRVEGPSLGVMTAIPGVTLPSTPPYLLEGDITREGQVVTIKLGTAKIGDSDLSAKLTFDAQPEPPMLSGNINAKKLVLQDLAPSVGGEPKPKTGESKKNAPEGRVLPANEFDIPSLHAMNADIRLDIDNLDLGTNVLLPVHALATHLVLKDGRLALNDIKATIADGSLTGMFKLDAETNNAKPLFNADLKLRDVDLAQWVRGDKINGEDMISGQFTGNVRVTGAGRSVATILGTLDGQLHGQILQGAVSHLVMEVGGLDLAQAIGVAISGKKPLPLNCAMMDLPINKGQVKSNLFLLDTTDTLLFMTGSVALDSEKLDLRIVPAPKDWSPLSLRSPITIGGQLADPSVAVDAAPIALKVLGGIALAAITPAAAVLALFDFGETDRGDGCKAAVRMMREKIKEVK
ncbi:AsmA family protein [Candidatus Nitrotoga sp. M5]|uniref:AsmA family protein n=1 Tax=Candidatus Nitrotoga sp. M5 TaxID=2890409 RepID=UPI001EF1E9A6|nr:AsmA family protein [Candidatus Nitrotoga sp. M5]CAH1386954.1 putative AsmA_2 domain-containing protein [Candidatus Nitrotoga sp. M5]